MNKIEQKRTKKEKKRKRNGEAAAVSAPAAASAGREKVEKSSHFGKKLRKKWIFFEKKIKKEELQKCGAAEVQKFEKRGKKVQICLKRLVERSRLVQAAS